VAAVPNLFAWWNDEVPNMDGSITEWAVEEAQMIQHHLIRKECLIHDAIRDFAQYGIFQQLAQVDPVLFIMMQCLRCEGDLNSIDPRVVSVPQPFLFAGPEADNEPFLGHYHKDVHSPSQFTLS
jgi:hypothetical protein